MTNNSMLYGRSTLLTIVFMLLSTITNAQGHRPPEPKAPGDAIILQNEKIISPERQTPQKAEGETIYNGAKSPVRVKDNINIIVRVPDNATQEGAGEIYVSKLIHYMDTGKRRLNANYDTEVVNFNAKKYGRHSYLLAFDKLSPGEYCIRLKEGSDAHCLFGVD